MHKSKNKIIIKLLMQLKFPKSSTLKLNTPPDECAKPTIATNMQFSI
jgi:hypothetical protein